MLSPFANAWIVERRYNVITTLTSFQSNVHNCTVSAV